MTLTLQDIVVRSLFGFHNNGLVKEGVMHEQFLDRKMF
jgi:hypothetical protein